MARTRLACFVAVAATVCWTGTAGAQVEPDFEWTADRPDAIAPFGVTGDRTYEAGRLVLWYRFEGKRWDGYRIGTNPVALSSVLNTFEVAPLRMATAVQKVGVAYGLSDWLTLEGQVPFLVNKVQDLTTTDTTFKVLSGFQVDSDRFGFGDVRAVAHLQVLDRTSYRAHVTGGVSIPVGSFYQDAVNPLTSQVERLPFPMQIGSGTWDGIAGFTLTAQHPSTSTGIQAMGLFRPHWNELNYRLGHQVETSVWGSYALSDWVSLSARIFAHWQGDPTGSFQGIDPLENPAGNPQLQGGTQVDLPLGINVYFPEGRFEGHRLGVEWAIPIHQDLDGPQLERNWTLHIGWYAGAGLLF